MKQFRQVSTGILMTVAASFFFVNANAQTYSLTPSGNMEGANWAAVPQSTLIYPSRLKQVPVLMAQNR